VSYYLLKDRKPVPCTRDEWLETYPLDFERTQIATTHIGNMTVSTIFLGDGVLFETMVYGQRQDDPRNFIRQCSTWAEAEIQHMEVCEALER
jgi:hypothetical protein